MAAPSSNGNGSNGNGIHPPPEVPKLPKTWNAELVEQVLERVSRGETLRAVCREITAIDESTFRSWVVADINGLATRYAHARMLQLEAWADEMEEIASDGRNDFMELQRKRGGTSIVFNREAVERSRLRIDTRKWLMSKLAPKKYGEHVAVTTHEIHDFRFTIRAEAEEEPGTNGDSTAGGSRIPAAVVGAN